MSTTPLTDAINALTQYANDTTGASDTTLSDAVGTLVAGYGGGDQATIDMLVTGIMDKDYTFTQTTIGRAFSNLSGAQYSLTLPNVTTFRVGNYTFENSDIDSLNIPNITGNVGSIFRGYKGKHINAPKITGIQTMDGCTNMTEVFFPAVSAGSNCFSGMSNIETAVVGTLRNNQWQHFLRCQKLTAVDLVIDEPQRFDNTFDNSPLLTVIVLRPSTVVTLHNTSAFNGTPFASGGSGGTIYVPQALLATYPTSGNWATVNGYGTITWQAIEGSQYETHYADGTVIE